MADPRGAQVLNGRDQQTPALHVPDAESANTARRERSSYIPELDGIRGLAIGLVFAGHMLDGWPTPAGVAQQIPGVLRFVLSHGWLGVDLFFVLSGFLITGILLDSKAFPQYFRNFYARRFLRIIPVYLIVVALMWIGYGGPARYFFLSILFLANFSQAAGVEPPHGAAALWSLAVEEHFYLVWPWLVRFLDRRRLLLLAGTIVIGVPCLRVWAAAQGVSDAAIYMYSWYRFDGLALGALLALCIRSGRVTKQYLLTIGGLLILCSVVLTVAGIPFGIMSAHNVLRFTQAELVFAAMVLGAYALRGSVFTAPLRSRIAILAGNLSYCVYLIHLAVGDAVEWWRNSTAIGRLVPVESLGLLVFRGAAILALTTALALLSRTYIERPIQALKRHFERGEMKGSARGAAA